MGLITPKGKKIRVNISPNIDPFERGGKNAGFLCKVVLVGEEKGGERMPPGISNSYDNPY